MPNFFLSEDDVDLLKRLIDEAERKGFGLRINPPTRSPTTAKNDNSPECYIAYPQGYNGIPAMDYGAPGVGACDIYRIVGTGEDVELVLVEGFTQQVYNFTETPISESYFLIHRDKYGFWVPGGSGGGSGAEIVHFRTESLCYGLNLGSGCSCVEAVVTRVPCNSTIAVGDSITLWDPDQCYFNIPADLLIGLQGTAMLMKTGSDLGGAHCVQTPDIGACMWVVHTLCCVEESYA